MLKFLTEPKIGLHILAYNCVEYIDKFLYSWLKVKDELNISISVGHVVFKEFFELGYSIESPDKTHEKLQNLKDQGIIDYYTFFNEPKTEIQARTEILTPLNEKTEIDILWLAAFDEIYQENEIRGALNFVKDSDFITWFRIEFKNLVFTENQYIKGFNPPRIFLNKNGLRAKEFFGDDEPVYSSENTGGKLSYLNFTSQQVPIKLCNPLHYTWLDDERSRNKIKYQISRWGPNGCSYCTKNGKLDFNIENYKKSGKSLPEVFKL